MKKEIWVAGYPSFLGGADTELLHNICLWRKHDVDVNLVPLFGCDSKIQQVMTEMGCITHNYNPKIFKDKILISYCNGNFLNELPKISEQGKPKMVLWNNCMTFSFPKEIEAHKNGLIDYHVFVSDYQRKWLEPQLSVHKKVNILEGYKPYFDPNNKLQQIEFSYREPQDWFALGRISRDDGAKFSSDMWNIFYKVCTPKQKKVFILGYGPNAHKKCGNAPNGLDWQTWEPNVIPVKNFYNLIHCIIHKTGGSRESYCRIVPEAYSFGVPMIVENDYAFPQLIQNEVTGYICNSSDEMSYRASELAFNEQKRKDMIFAGRDFLINEIASVDKCWSAWEQLWK